MGVVYKLIPEISSFIIEQKRNNARVSCQDLAELVYSQFGQRISKSSVHELLKNAQVIHPRTRSAKQKFQIPTEKKAQLFGDPSLTSFVQDDTKKGIVQDDVKKSIVQDETKNINVILNPPKAGEESQKPINIQPNMGEIFLKAAFYDLSFKPILGLQDYQDIGSLNSDRLRMDWGYLTTPVESFKVELEDGHGFYIDARFQGLYEENPHEQSLAVPIERAIAQMSDYLFNNIKPIIIRNTRGQLNSTVPLSHFISAFENLPGKTINKILLVAASPADGGANGQTLTEFNQPLKMRRDFILGLDANTEDFQVRAPVQVFKKDDKSIITNLNPDSCDIWGMYLDRHSGTVAHLPVRQAELSPLVCDRPLPDDMTNQPQWLKNRLKERALMFFPSEMPPAALEEILTLPGYGDKEIHLQIPPGFPYLAHVQKAAARLNNLDIANNKRERLKICIE